MKLTTLNVLDACPMRFIEERSRYMLLKELLHHPDHADCSFSPTTSQLDYVLTIVEASGRLDQIMANINTLFTGPKILNMPLYQLCSDSLSWVLEPGHHRIHVDNSLFHRWCGLIPVQGPARVTTKGLKWDLGKNQTKLNIVSRLKITKNDKLITDFKITQDGHKLQFGALVSTSNQWTEARVVTLETDRAILITTGHGE